MLELDLTFIGRGIGYLADFVSAIIRKPLPVSSIRVKKFMETTQFNSSIEETGFAPIELSDGLSRTLKYEFIENNSDKPILKQNELSYSTYYLDD